MRINFTGWRTRAGRQGEAEGAAGASQGQQEHLQDSLCSMWSWGWQSGIMPEPWGKEFSLLGETGAGTNTVTCKPVVSGGHPGYRVWWGMNMQVCFVSQWSDPRAPHALLGHGGQVQLVSGDHRAGPWVLLVCSARALGNQLI